MIGGRGSAKSGDLVDVKSHRLVPVSDTRAAAEALIQVLPAKAVDEVPVARDDVAILEEHPDSGPGLEAANLDLRGRGVRGEGSERISPDRQRSRTGLDRRATPEDPAAVV